MAREIGVAISEPERARLVRFDTDSDFNALQCFFEPPLGPASKDVQMQYAMSREAATAEGAAKDSGAGTAAPEARGITAAIFVPATAHDVSPAVLAALEEAGTCPKKNPDECRLHPCGGDTATPARDGGDRTLTNAGALALVRLACEEHGHTALALANLVL